MDIFDVYKTDDKAEVEGRWFPLSKTAKVLVARTGNPRYSAAFRKKLQEHELDLNTGGPEADELAEALLVDVMSHTILLGWEGLKFQGEEVSYSKEMSRTMLKVKDFRKKVVSLSDSMENFKVRAEEQQGKD